MNAINKSHNGHRSPIKSRGKKHLRSAAAISLARSADGASLIPVSVTVIEPVSDQIGVEGSDTSSSSSSLTSLDHSSFLQDKDVNVEDTLEEPEAESITLTVSHLTGSVVTDDTEATEETAEDLPLTEKEVAEKTVRHAYFSFQQALTTHVGSLSSVDLEFYGAYSRAFITEENHQVAAPGSLANPAESDEMDVDHVQDVEVDVPFEEGEKVFHDTIDDPLSSRVTTWVASYVPKSVLDIHLPIALGWTHVKDLDYQFRFDGKNVCWSFDTDKKGATVTIRALMPKDTVVMEKDLLKGIYSHNSPRFISGESPGSPKVDHSLLFNQYGNGKRGGGNNGKKSSAGTAYFNDSQEGNSAPGNNTRSKSGAVNNCGGNDVPGGDGFGGGGGGGDDDQGGDDNPHINGKSLNGGYFDDEICEYCKERGHIAQYCTKRMRDEQSGKTTSRSLSFHLPQTVIASPKNQTSSRVRSISDVSKELSQVSVNQLITFRPKGHGSNSYSHNNDDEYDDDSNQLIPMGTSSYNRAARGVTSSAVEEIPDNRSGGSSADSWTEEDYKNFGLPADRDHRGSIGNKSSFKSGSAVFAPLIHTPMIGAKPVKKGDGKEGEEEDGEEDESVDHEKEEDSDEVSTAATEPVAPPATVTGGTSATRRGSRTVGAAVSTTTPGALVVVPSTPAVKPVPILNKNGYNNIVPPKMIPVVVPAGTVLRCIWCCRHGHVFQDCPNGICSACGEKGHTSFKCPRGLS